MWFWLSFLLLGMVVYLPLGMIIWFCLVVPFANWLEKRGNYDVAALMEIVSFVLLITCAVLVHGGFFGWYDHIEKPAEIIVYVDENVKNDFYKSEEIGGEINLTVSDKNFSEYNKSHLADNGYIRFDITNKDAKKERANLKWVVEVNGKEYERNDLPTGTEIHLFDDSFALPVGKSTVKIVAKNNLGEATKTIVINKLSTEEECAKSDNAEVALCMKIKDSNLADAEKEAEKNSSNSSSYSSTPSPAVPNRSSNTCDYYEYDRCWDDVIEKAYEDGYQDAYYGHHSYYQECEGVCFDIYDEAYEKGYYYGRLEYGGEL